MSAGLLSTNPIAHPPAAGSYAAVAPSDPAFRAMEQLCAGSRAPAEVEKESAAAFASSGDARWARPLGLALWMQQRYQEALEALDKGSKACDNDCDYHIICGMVARQLPGHEQRALASYRCALAIDPNRSDTLYNLGNLLKDDDPEEAERCYRRSLAINPQAATTWHNLGIALNNQHRYREALSPIALSLRLDPQVADAWCNLGLAWYGLEDFRRSESCFRFTIGLDSSHAPSHINLGNALISRLQPEEALQHLERGVELDGSSTNSLWNLALAYLLLGRYRTGWTHYEARFHTKDFEKVQIPTAGPQVRRFEELPRPGDPPLVVWSEQGLGDAIQFCRYLALLDAAQVPFVFLTRPALLLLMRGWTGLGERVQPQKSTDAATDPRPHIALMSLPMVFGTELHTIPSVAPYLSPPEPPSLLLQVPPPPGGLAVGIVWASNPDNRAMYRNKSMPLELLMPRLIDLVELDLIDLHSLQFGEDASQLDPWRCHERVTDWKDRLSDFADTAHVIRQLDLVISVDTAVAHLAGALNRPTWLLLPQNADFRWLKDRSDCPWYPSMRLFRQTNHGDWGSVISQVKATLDELFLLDLDALAGAKLR